MLRTHHRCDVPPTTFCTRAAPNVMRSTAASALRKVIACAATLRRYHRSQSRTPHVANAPIWRAAASLTNPAEPYFALPYACLVTHNRSGNRHTEKGGEASTLPLRLMLLRRPTTSHLYGMHPSREAVQGTSGKRSEPTRQQSHRTQATPTKHTTHHFSCASPEMQYMLQSSNVCSLVFLPTVS